MSLTGLVISKAALNNLARIPFKIRAQLIKKAKALITDQHPQGSKPLKGVTTDDGEAVYRLRSGDYRILYIVRSNPTKEVIVLDINNRKDVYK
jgi:mRNA interferase RelE/StbE